jgi:hypothetical protein
MSDYNLTSVAATEICQQRDLFPELQQPQQQPPVVKTEIQVVDGVQVSIVREDGKIIRLQSLGDYPTDAKVTQQQDGRSYCTIPGYGTMPKTKNEPAVLAWFANACRALEITRILTSNHKQSGELLQELQPLLEAQKQLAAAEKDSTKTPRARKKDLHLATDVVYANFFVEDKTVFFAKAFDWLLEIPNGLLRPIEKIILERLMKPKWGGDGFCKGIDEQTGIINGLKQRQLAKAVGLGYSALNENLIALQTAHKPDGKPWILLIGRELRLVWKQWCMPEKFRTCGQIPAGKNPHLRIFGSKKSAPADEKSAPADFSPSNIDKKKVDREREDEFIALGNSIPNTSGNASDSVCLEGYQNQNQPARDHPKWPEFARYCRGQRDKRGNPGQPTEKGFRTWLNKQNPKWRNTPAPNPDGELGWELNGKFYTQEQATQLGIQDPDLQVKFRRARRRDGKIVIISEPKR